MNASYVLYHLKEAADEIRRLVEEDIHDPEFLEHQFVDAMRHVFHHVNTAYNARNVTEAEARECSESDYYLWRKFSEDLDMSE